MNTAEKFIQILEESEIDTVFGLPCGQLNPYYGALATSDIRHIPARSEAAAAIMADGYARTNYTIGVCDGVGSSGAAYQSAGIVEAYGACSPVVALTGDNARDVRGREIIQDLDNERFLEPITKENYDPENPDRAIEAFRDGVRVATTGTPGPVHINLPADITSGQVSDDVPEDHIRTVSYPHTRPEPDSNALRKAAEIVTKADRPIVLSGEGALRARAWDEVQTLVEKTGMPVITSLNGKGIIPETDRHAAGVAGRWGYSDVANDELRNADTVVALGCRFGDLTTDGWSLLSDDAEIVHVDLDPSWLEKNYAASVPVMADVGAFVAALVDELDESDFDEQRDRIDDIEAAYEEWFESHSEQFTSSKTPINPQRVVAEVQKVAPSDSIVVSATSYIGFSTAAFYQVEEPGMNYIQARGSDGINFCLPQSLGVQAANPDRQVFALSGDGGFGYHVAELETAAREKLPVTVVIVNNHAFGSSKVSLENKEGIETSTELSTMTYAEVARGFGCAAETITEPENIQGALQNAVDSDEPTLLDVKVNREDLPPGGSFGNYGE